MENNPRPGAKALEDSLKSAFAMLKWTMLLLLAAYCLSGVYFVREGTVALQLRLGRPHGSPGKEITLPGGPHFALPLPLDEVVTLPTSLQELGLEREFWFDTYEEDSGRPLDQVRPPPRLAPERDGSMLTGDRCVVHAKWSASFQVSKAQEGGGLAGNALKCLRNVGDMAAARALVSRTLENAALEVVSRTPVDAFYKGGVDTEAVKRLAQAELDKLGTGLALSVVALKERTVPLATLRDFQAVGGAESSKAKAIEAASQERERLLNDIAGPAYGELLASLDQLDAARRKGDQRRVAAVEAAIDELLLAEELGGASASMIQDALASRARSVEFVRGSSQRFQAMLALHKLNPALFERRQIQDATQKVFENALDSQMLTEGPDKTLYLEMGEAQ